MKITFLLPVPASKPLGGAKVIYEHANRLAERGHSVSIVHSLAPSTISKGYLVATIAYLMKVIGFLGGFGARRWMKVNENIKLYFFPTLDNFFIPRGDIVFATSWGTAEYMMRYSSSKGKKYYFVQDYEFFKTSNNEIKERMAITYRAGFVNLAISPACESIIIESNGVVAQRVPNGIDHQIFKLTRPIEDRDRVWIGFASRGEIFKRTIDAIRVCDLVRQRLGIQKINFWTYGSKKPQELPDWINFIEKPTDEELVEWYNKTKVFLVTSDYEGWGLPGSEAMCCGATLVSTLNGGVSAYATHNTNAILLEARDIQAMADTTINLCENEELRIGLAKNALESIKEFTWEKSSQTLELTLSW